MTEPMLSVDDAAEYCGINPGTWRDYVSSGFAPAPDDPDDTDPDGRPIPPNRRRPRWYFTTVQTWHAARPRPRNRTHLNTRETS